MATFLIYYRYYSREEEECNSAQEAWDLAQNISWEGEGYPICICIDSEPIYIGDYGFSKYSEHDKGEKILRDVYKVDLGEYHFWKPPPPPKPEHDRFASGELKIEDIVHLEREVNFCTLRPGDFRQVAVPGAVIVTFRDGSKTHVNHTECKTLADNTAKMLKN